MSAKFSTDKPMELSTLTIKKWGRVFVGSLLACILVAIYLLFAMKQEMKLKPIVPITMTLILLWAFLSTIYAFYAVWRMAERQQSLKESEESHRSVLGGILDSIGVGISVITPDMEVLSMNEVMKKRHPGVDVTRRPTCYKVFHYPPLQDFCPDCPVCETIQDGQVHEATRDVHRGRDTKTVRLLCSPIKDDQGRLVAVAELVEDITERKQSERKLMASEARFRSMVDHNADGIVAITPDGAVLHVNPAAEALLGHQEEELVGKPFAFPVVVGRETEVEITRNGSLVVAAMRAVETEWEAKPARLVSMRDVTDRKRVEEHLRSLALVDELTELYNRRGFLMFGQRQLKIADRAKQTALLLVADMDNMSQINQTQGKEAGDKALTASADVLRKAFRESDVLARIGHDEFAILALGALPGTAEMLKGRLNRHLEASNAAGKAPCKLSMSVGVSAYDPSKPCSLEDLMARAEEAMRQSRKA